MKKIIVLTIVMLATGFSNVFAQVTPPGAGDKDLRDTNIKGRSNELERIDRDAKKEAAKKEASNKKDKSLVKPADEQPEDKLAVKFDEIKTDYEQIQLFQDSIIKAYKSCDKIDYAQIGKLSLEINKSATRLNLNLFPAPIVENPDTKKDLKKEEKTDKEIKTPKGMRDIIIELDNTIGRFVASPMFQNLRAADQKDSEKVKIDLEKIIELSGLLNAEAQKIVTTGK